MGVFAYIKNRLVGGFETALFLPHGLDKFSGKPRETWISFSILLVSLPLSYLTMHVHQPIGTEGFSLEKIYMVHMFSTVVEMVIGFLMIYGFARFVTGGNTEKIWLYYTLSNWLGFVFLPLGLLFVALRYYGIFGPKTMEDVMLVLTLYGYAIGGFIVYRVFKPPMELAVALVCFILVMGQGVLNASYDLWGLPNVDYMEVYGPSATQTAEEAAPDTMITPQPAETPAPPPEG